jgi:hypothetical protein
MWRYCESYTHIQGAERGLQRLEAAVGVTGPEALARILDSLKLDSMKKIDNLKMLKEIVLRLEQIAAEGKRSVRNSPLADQPDSGVGHSIP